jgi:hypothetical protein
VKKRDDAMKPANAYPNSDLGRPKAEECKRFDLTIAGIDEALKAYECVLSVAVRGHGAHCGSFKSPIGIRK